jgi:hypothetical protein
MRAVLAGAGKQSVHQSRTEIASRVDGIARRRTRQRQTDAPHQAADQQRAQTGRRTGEGYLARRKRLRDGDDVNLGIGIATLVAK